MTTTSTEQAKQVPTDCGHLHDEDDTTTCADGITDAPTSFGAGRCYRDHRNNCGPCIDRDTNDHDRTSDDR